jgi:hypothetical protein
MILQEVGGNHKETTMDFVSFYEESNERSNPAQPLNCCFAAASHERSVSGSAVVTRRRRLSAANDSRGMQDEPRWCRCFSHRAVIVSKRHRVKATAASKKKKKYSDKNTSLVCVCCLCRAIATIPILLFLRPLQGPHQMICYWREGILWEKMVRCLFGWRLFSIWGAFCFCFIYISKSKSKSTTRPSESLLLVYCAS